jgi:hypothetical protein
MAKLSTKIYIVLHLVVHSDHLVVVVAKITGPGELGPVTTRAEEPVKHPGAVDHFHQGPFHGEGYGAVVGKGLDPEQTGKTHAPNSDGCQATQARF